jgi:hypothetical protein
MDRRRQDVPLGVEHPNSVEARFDTRYVSAYDSLPDTFLPSGNQNQWMKRMERILSKKSVQFVQSVDFSRAHA